MDLKEISEAAERLVVDGRPVSVRAVRASLKARGSDRDIGPRVAHWTADPPSIKRALVADVPSDSQNRDGEALTAVWNEARVIAVREHVEERERLKAELCADDEIRGEALAEADRLRDEVEFLRRELGRLQDLLEERDARLARVRAEEFRDRVMMEIRETLPAAGGMTVEDIPPRLRETVRREAADHKERVTPAIPREKMLTRLTHGRDLKASGDGAFARRRSSTPKAGANPGFQGASHHFNTVVATCDPDRCCLARPSLVF